MNEKKPFASPGISQESASSSPDRKTVESRGLLRSYLRLVNPVVAFVILLLCLYASMKGEQKEPPQLSNVVSGFLLTYFFAKGLFCSSAVFLLGKLLEVMLDIRDSQSI